MIAKFQNKTVGLVGLTTTMTAAVMALTACSAGSGTSASTGRLQVYNQQLSVDSNSSSGVQAQTVAVSPTLTLTAAIASPLLNGVTLQANSTAFTGTNIYISYNVAGAAAGGGVDQISIVTPAVPILSSSVQFPTLDVNNVLVSNSVLYVSGNSSTADYAARLQSYLLPISGAIGAIQADSPLTGYAADSAKAIVGSNSIYTVSGDNGGLTILDATALPTVTSTPPPLTVAIQDARDIATTNLLNALTGQFRAFVVTGNATTTNSLETAGHSYIRSYSSTGTAVNAVDIGSTGPSQSKSTISAGLTYGIASAGTAGVKVFCLADLGILASAAPLATGGVVNAAVYLAGYVFTAEGDQGVGVYALNAATGSLGACNNSSLVRLGTINFGASVSANNVSVVGNLLLVSGGLGGFKIVNVAPNALVTGLITTL